jgi:hypothetical protein
MYDIKKTNYGFRITFGGFMTMEEVQKWAEEFAPKARASRGKYSVLVDMRTLKPLPSDAQEFMLFGQQEAHKNGMERSAAIVNSPITLMQFKRMSKTSGIDKFERYIDASANPNWEKIALEWVEKGIDKT